MAIDPMTLATLAGGLSGGGGGDTSVSQSTNNSVSGNFAINPTISIATGPGSYSYPSTNGNASGSPSASGSASAGGGEDGWPADYPYDPAPGAARPVSDLNKPPEFDLAGFADSVPGGMPVLIIGGLAAAWYLMK